jgi:hypothetical protein
MGTNIRYPDINGKSTPEQISQLKSYLHQLVGELNFALGSIESGGASFVDAKGSPVSPPTDEKDDPVSTFNGIKALIIKSADIVNAYYAKIDSLLKLSGDYVAEATFPEGAAKFIEQTNQNISANSKSIEAAFKNNQKIESEVESMGSFLRDINAWVKIGLLDESDGVYGLEIGQRSEVNGVEVFNKYARFTSNKLSFYDSNDNEVAYISDRRLYITHIEVIGSFKIGSFVDSVLSDGSVVTRWVEYGGES